MPIVSNDTASIWRHHYHPKQKSLRSLRSGYSNVLMKQEKENHDKFH